MLNLDTHMLVAVFAGTLTPAEEARVADEPLAISDIVLWELAKLVQLRRLTMDLQGAEFIRCLDRIRVFPVTRQIAIASTELDFKADPADELIAATSVVEGVPLLTRDKRIRRSRMVPLA